MTSTRSAVEPSPFGSSAAFTPSSIATPLQDVETALHTLYA